MDFERLKDHLVQLTRDLVLIESTDSRPEERQRCFQLIRNHLEEISGIELRQLEKNGYEALVALPEGGVRPEVIFCGHLDVVEHPNPGSYRSELKDGRIYGPGTGDMKGQLAILVQLMRYLWREYPGLPVGLAITSDEERGGENGVRFLVEEAGLEGGVAVIPDGGSLTDLIIEEKGILHLRIRAEGAAAHAARPWQGHNALDLLIRAVRRVQDEIFAPFAPAEVVEDDLETHWFPTCTVTAMGTPNDSPNRIPGTAEAILDVRFIAPETVDTMLRQIHSRLELESGVSCEVIVAAEPTHLAPDSRFLEITSAVTGKPARLVRACGGSDARFFSARGIPVLLSRPLVGNLHGDREWIDINSMVAYFEICRRYVLERTGMAEREGPG